MSPGFTVWVAEMVHCYRARLLSYARRRGLAPEDALDVVQDSFASFLTLPQAQSIARTAFAMPRLPLNNSVKLVVTFAYD
jgi:hypothetical protein